MLWPGFGDNSRVLKWMLPADRRDGRGRRNPIGLMPKEATSTLRGLRFRSRSQGTPARR